MLLFGIDVIVTKDGRHLVIDCNYFSSYTGIEQQVLASKFDSLFDEIKPRVIVKQSYCAWWSVILLAGAIALTVIKRKK